MHAAIREELSRNRMTLVNCFGRSRRFLDRWGNDLFQKAYNFRAQSTVARKINRDGVRFVYEDQETFEHLTLLNQVHDAIWYQVPLWLGIEYVVSQILTVRASLEASFQIRGRDISLPVDTKLGFNLNEDEMLEWKSKYVRETSEDKLAEELETFVGNSVATTG